MEIEIFREGDITLPYKNISEKAIKDIVKKTGGYLDLNKKRVTVILTDNNYIRELNNKYRNKDRATDVISFDYRDENFPGEECDPSHLGDIYISLEKAREQSVEYNVSLEDELKRLLVHGMLHLMGYDHEASPEEEKKMKQKEEDLIQKIK